jgi:hypothetical protein
LQIDFPEDLAAKAIDPFVRAEGHLLVLLFVRTDCPISNRYAPTIQNLSEKFHHKAYFWLVYPDAHESAARVRAYLAQFRYSIPALRDVHHTLVKPHRPPLPKARCSTHPENSSITAESTTGTRFGRSRPKLGSRSAAGRRGLETGLHD